MQQRSGAPLNDPGVPIRKCLQAATMSGGE